MTIKLNDRFVLFISQEEKKSEPGITSLENYKLIPKVTKVDPPLFNFADDEDEAATDIKLHGKRAARKRSRSHDGTSVSNSSDNETIRLAGPQRRPI